MTTPTQYRQGDVLLVRVGAMPATARPVAEDPRGVVLAEGEATGHHHRIGPAYRTATLYAHDEGTFLRVTGGATSPVVLLTHEEHDPIAIPPGDYRVIRQMEYSPDAVRRVED
jgi:hypothetical protein